MQWGRYGIQWGHYGMRWGHSWSPSPLPTPQPPTPEADYPELSPDELEVYPEEDCSPPGSYQWGAAPYAPPRRHQELTVSPRWYGPPGDHEQFGTETVWGRGGGRRERGGGGDEDEEEEKGGGRVN